MNLWHDVEMLCPVCKTWRACGAATTAENFRNSESFFQDEGRFILSCGHEVSAAANQGRLGPEIRGIGQRPSRPRHLPERRKALVDRRQVSRRSSAGDAVSNGDRMLVKHELHDDQRSGDPHETAEGIDRRERDLAAEGRDRAAEARDVEDDKRDAEIAGLTSFFASERPTSRNQIIMRAALDRQGAADDRARSAARRVDAGGDRLDAASDRLRAAGDRAEANAERKANALDTLTGARRRGPGLRELQRQIDHARRGTGQLVVAYVDIDGLKATNDTKGHAAGDALLKHVVGVVQTHLRSYEPIIRLGGDEFACSMSDATIETVRQRFDQITAELAAALEDSSISVGFAELGRGDTAMDVINRADTALMAARRIRNR